MSTLRAEFSAVVIGEGNHASIAIPEKILSELGTNQRAPLKITVNGHTYQSTATAVGGQCLVVFPMADRKLAGVVAGETVTVQVELDAGYREVPVPPEIRDLLLGAESWQAFEKLPFYKRKSLIGSIAEAKKSETRTKRIEALLKLLNENL